MAINVACGERVTVADLADRMAKLLGREDLTATLAPDRAGDVKHSLADLTLAKSILGYEPIVDYPSGLAATLEWYKTAGV